MSHNTRSRAAWMAIVLAITACSDDKKAVELPACEITSPSAGAFVGLDQDASPTLAGIQVDVAVRTKNAAGGQVTLRVGTDDLAPQSASADGTVTFAAVALPEGPAATVLTCRVSAGGTTTQGPDVPVVVGSACSLEFAAPAIGTRWTRADTRTGTDGRPVADVVVVAKGVEAGTPVTLEIGDAGQARTLTATLSPDQATFEVPVVQGTATRFFARAAGLRCQPQAELRIDVDLGDCVTSIAPANGANLGIAADTSPAPGGRAGLQTELCVATECADGANALLRIDTGTEQRATVAGGRACFEVTLNEGTRNISARVEGATQSGTADAARYCVDLTAPTASISAPATGATLAIAQDRDPATPGVLDFLVEGTTAGTTTSGCTIARPVDRVELIVNGSVQDHFAPSNAGSFVRTARFPQGANKLQVCAIDQVGNRGCSAEIDLTIELNLPTLRIVSPTANARLLKATDPVGATAAREVDVSVSATGLAANTNVLFDADQGQLRCSAALVITSGNTGTAQVRFGEGSCPALPDGAHVLTAHALDANGNYAVSQEVAVVVDGTAPTVRFTEPVDGFVFVDRARADIVVATSAEDGQSVTLETTGMPTLRAIVSGGGAVFPAVAIPAGMFTLTARVSDAAGNPSSANIQGRNVTGPALDLAPTFDNLATGQRLGSGDDVGGNLADGFQFNVRLGVAAGVTRVLLQVSGGPAYSGEPTNGRVDLTGVELAEGSNALVATGFDAFGRQGSRLLRVEVSTGRLQVGIAEPAAGAALPASVDADPATPGIQLPVLVATNATSAISSCFVVTDPGASQVQWTLTPKGSTCAGVVTLAEGAHTLVATVQAGTANGQSVRTPLTVSTRRATVAFVNPTIAYNASAPDVSGRPGFQTDIAVESSDVPEGTWARLSVSFGEAATVFSSQFVRQIGTPTLRATFSAVTLEDQRFGTLHVTNDPRSALIRFEASAPVFVDREAPMLRITTPAAGALLGDADDQDPGPGFGVTVTLAVDGVPAGRAVALEARAPNGGNLLASAAAVYDGASADVTFGDFVIPVSASGPVVLTARTSDDVGNAGVVSLAVHVDVQRGSITWFSPGATPSPTIVCAADDLDLTTPGVQRNLVFRTTDFANGALVTVNDAQGAVVGRGVVGTGSATITATLPEGESEHVLRATARRPSGNSATTADTRNIRVDTLGPTVSSFVCAGDANGDGFLNKNENRSPSLTDRFEMDCTVGFSDASMNGRTVRILSSAPAAGTVVGTAVVSGQTVTIPVTLVAGASPVGHQLSVSALDACNNAARAGTGVSLTYSATVDIAPPTVAITLPASGLLLAANDRVPAPPRSNGVVLECCNGLSGAFDITATVGGATGANASLKVGGAVRATATVPSDGIVRFPNAGLDQGSLALSVEVTDSAGNVGVSQLVNVTVDSIPPTVSITSPTANQQIGTNTIEVTVSYSDLESGRVLEVRRRNAGSGGTGAFTVAGTGTATGSGTTTINIVLPQGTHELQAYATDVNGNPGASTPVNIDVTSSNPVVTFTSPATNPARFNAASGTVNGGQIAIDIVISTGAPAGSTAVLLKGGAQVAGPVTIDGAGQGRFDDVSFGTTESGILQARVTTGTGTFDSVALPFSVDVDPPTLAFSSPTCKLTLTVADDTDPASPGTFVFGFTTNAEVGQVVSLTTDQGMTGTCNQPGTNCVSGAVTSGGTVTTPALTLAQGLHILTATVQDLHGNERVEICTTTVDALPPTITGFAASRHPTKRSVVRLSWTMPGDDGTSTAPVASYELVQRICDLSTNCTIANDTDFAAATPVPNPPAIVSGGTPIGQSPNFFEVTIPLEKQTTFAMRATDSEGNVSAIVSATVENKFNTDTSIAGPGGETDFGNAVRAIQIDNDSLSDLLVGRPQGIPNGTGIGGFRVVYGNGNTTTEVLGGALGLTDTASRLGFSVDDAGDVDGDGFSDVIVGAPGLGLAANPCSGTTDLTQPSTGKAFILFGGPEGLPAGTTPVACGGANKNCYIELTPPAADVSTRVCNFGMSVAGTGDLATSSSGTRSMVAVGAGDRLGTSTRIGRAFVYSVSGTRPVVAASLVATMVGGSDDFHFGAAVCGVRDVSGDNIPDLVVTAPRNQQTPTLGGRAYVFLGGSARFGSTGTVVNVTSGGSSTSDGIVPIDPQFANDFFGRSCRPAGDLDGDGINDFVVAASQLPGFYAVRGRADLDMSPPTTAPNLVRVTVTAGLVTGEIDAGHDVDGDGRPDVVLGSQTSAFVFGGSATSVVSSTSMVTFSGLPSTSTGLPVALVPNFKNTLAGETAWTDIVIGRASGPSVAVRY